MSEHRRDPAAVGRWGRRGPAHALGQHLDGRAEQRRLPPGYRAQPAWEVHDELVVCEFYRVYGPPSPNDRRGPVCQLDEGLSYWSVRWGSDGPVPASVHWLRYCDARRPPNTELTFERFSSLGHARRDLRGH